MMFVLDTCFVSEFEKEPPNPGVIEWTEQQVESDLWLTTMTLGEVVKGILRLPAGKKRTGLEIWYAKDLLRRFAGRILGFDEASAHEWGGLCARLERAGAQMPAVDSQIAAICLRHDAVLVTRNTEDFVRSGISMVNPWT